MRYAGILCDDFVNGQNVCVSFWAQGCNLKCPGCHNAQTWDFNGGTEVTADTIPFIIKAISKNNIQRNFSVLGGEPLCPENRSFVLELVQKVREAYPTVRIFLWTGYELSELKEENNPIIDKVLSLVDTLITGRFVLAERDITLPLRGSRNQKVLHKGEDF